MNTALWHDELFADVLACEEVRPAAFLSEPLDATAARGAASRAEALLRALAVVEDGRGEEPEEHSAHSAALVRVEAKLDLLMAMMATLGRQTHHDPERVLQWSARGVRLRMPAPVAVGSAGTFRVQPVDWLPEPLLLPATVRASINTGGEHELWLRFGPLSATLEASLERHLFRQHRRAIAESRRPR